MRRVQIEVGCFWLHFLVSICNQTKVIESAIFIFKNNYEQLEKLFCVNDQFLTIPVLILSFYGAQSSEPNRPFLVK